MNKQYLTEEWKQFRFKIFKRDNFTCIKCNARGNLQCHHKYYVRDWKLWDYPDSAMETLCRLCHEEFHKTKKGGQIFIKKKVAIKYTEQEKNNKKNDEYKKVLNHLDLLRLKFEITKLKDLSQVKKKDIPQVKRKLEEYLKILEYNESLKK
jgi:hypothetical protein